MSVTTWGNMDARKSVGSYLEAFNWQYKTVTMTDYEVPAPDERSGKSMLGLLVMQINVSY